MQQIFDLMRYSIKTKNCIAIDISVFGRENNLLVRTTLP